MLTQKPVVITYLLFTQKGKEVLVICTVIRVIARAVLKPSRKKQVFIKSETPLWRDCHLTHVTFKSSSLLISLKNFQQ